MNVIQTAMLKKDNDELLFFSLLRLTVKRTTVLFCVLRSLSHSIYTCVFQSGARGPLGCHQGGLGGCFSMIGRKLRDVCGMIWWAHGMEMSGNPWSIQLVRLKQLGCCNIIIYKNKFCYFLCPKDPLLCPHSTLNISKYKQK